jgi:type IV secretion system protein TrbL
MIVTQILFIGFFYWLLVNSSQFAGVIVKSFQTAASSAAQAGGVSMGMSPSDIFDVGLKLAGQFVSATSLWSPGASLGLFISALVIIFCFAIIAAFLILALVESYVVISAGVLFLGFGGSRWTKDLAIKIMVYAVSVGAKLFVLQLLIALGAQVFQELATTARTNNTTLFICIGSAIVMLALTKIIPDMIQGLINGTSFGASGALGSVVWGATKGTAAGVAAGGMAVGAARDLARAQNEERAAQGEAPRSLFGQTVRNLGGALLDNVGHRLSGRAHFGHRFGQTAYAMERQADETRQKAKDIRLNKQGAQQGQRQPPSGQGGKNP